VAEEEEVASCDMIAKTVKLAMPMEMNPSLAAFPFTLLISHANSVISTTTTIMASSTRMRQSVTWRKKRWVQITHPRNTIVNDIRLVAINQSTIITSITRLIPNIHPRFRLAPPSVRLVLLPTLTVLPTAPPLPLLLLRPLITRLLLIAPQLMAPLLLPLLPLLAAITTPLTWISMRRDA